MIDRFGGLVSIAAICLIAAGCEDILPPPPPPVQPSPPVTHGIGSKDISPKVAKTPVGDAKKIGTDAKKPPARKGPPQDTFDGHEVGLLPQTGQPAGDQPPTG